MKKIIIVGGGPSGIMAGIFAKKENNEVIILERNANPLKKLLITGSGKCNYMNEQYDLSFYHSEDMKEVGEILTDNHIKDVKDFFDQIGLISKNKNGYIYPYTFQSTTVEKVLREEALSRGVIIRNNTLVLDIQRENDTFQVVCENEMIPCDIVVLACGSKAYPKTGSDGMGYQFLEKFHHTIVEPVPALVQLVGNENYFKDWDGVRAEVRVELFEDGASVGQEEGEIQLTSYGVSGICVFNLSHFVSRGLLEHKEEIIMINFVPFMDAPFSTWMEQYSHKTKKNMKDLLEGFLSPKVSKIILKKCDISENDYYHDLSVEQQLCLCKYLKSFPVNIVGTKGFESSQICSGGVRLCEINCSTMESKKEKNLYIVGELLDMNGKCGGYNLTECWITGMLAGKSIGDES